MTSVGSEARTGLRYRPILALGQGGMADLHLASGRGPSGFKKLVVLKTLRKQLAHDHEMRDMFLAEARLSARLNHANVVQVYEVVDDTRPCIVMEYLDGQAMSAIQRAAGERFTTTMQLRVISEMLAGLHYSHELCDYDGTPLNIVHRDVSPQNIFITYDGLVKVLDFGIAKMVDAPSETKTGIIKGKLSYMAPEQLLAEGLDRRADIYAVGCMLWQAATGVKLWEDTDERTVLRNLIEGSIPPPSSKRVVDPRLEAIVLKAIAPNPNVRYPTALALQAAVDQYLAEADSTCTMREVGAFVAELYAEARRQRASAIRSVIATLSLAPPAPEAAEPTAPGMQLRSGVRERSPRIGAALVAATLLLVMGGGAGYYAFQERLREPPPLASAPPPTPRLVQVRLSVMPREATVTIDGKSVGGNPAVLNVPTDQLDHEVKAVSSTHEPIVRTIRFERDLALEMVLRQVAPEPANAPSAPAAVADPKPVEVGAPRARTRPKPKPPSRKDEGGKCDPPFFFDQGIKVYKPGCI